MDPRLLAKKLEGWWCAGQLSIDDLLNETEEEDKE